MGLIPKEVNARITWFESHLALWATNATAIGTSSTAVTDLTTKTTAARAGLTQQQLAKDNAVTATSAMRSALNTMTDAGTDIVKQIRTKAALVGGTSVYDLANIPAPATPSPIGPPGTPFEFIAQLVQDGSLILKWKCNNPAGASGTTYQVFRKTNADLDYVFIGASGEKNFHDDTVPASGGEMAYRIVAFRSTARGLPADFTVKLGVSGGAMTASVMSPKLAA